MYVLAQIHIINYFCFPPLLNSLHAKLTLRLSANLPKLTNLQFNTIRSQAIFVGMYMTAIRKLKFTPCFNPYLGFHTGCFHFPLNFIKL